MYIFPLKNAPQGNLKFFFFLQGNLLIILKECFERRKNHSQISCINDSIYIWLETKSSNMVVGCEVLMSGQHPLYTRITASRDFLAVNGETGTGTKGIETSQLDIVGHQMCVIAGLVPQSRD